MLRPKGCAGSSPASGTTVRWRDRGFVHVIHAMTLGEVMILIWRRWGWLVLPAFLLAWWLSNTVIQPIYLSVTGYEVSYNADDAIAFGIATCVVAPLVFGVDLLFRRLFDKAVGPTTPGTAATTGSAGVAPESIPLPAPVRVRRPAASCFWIPMWIWAIIFAVIGVFMIIYHIPLSIADAQLR